MSFWEMISPGLIIFKKSDPHRLRFISSLSVKVLKAIDEIN